MKDRNIELLVSIITVVYNGESTLEDTIISVLNQSYSNIEYIIIDGRSSDRTIDLIRKYQNKITRWISEPDEGIYDAMNKGIKMAHGEIIGILNSGDLFLKDTVETVIDIYRENKLDNPYGIITGAMYRFDLDRNINFKLIKNKEDLDKNIHWGMPLNHPATFVTKAVYPKLGFFNSSYKICADYDLIYRAYYDPEVNFIFTDRILAYMSLGGISEQFSSLVIRCMEHFYIESDRVFWFFNILRRLFWLSKEVSKYFIKKISSDRFLKEYYKIRHLI